MNEEQVRKIIKEEFRKNYMSGSPDIPPHRHNGTDNLQIDPVNLIGWSAVPYTNGGFGGNLVSGRQTISSLGLVKNEDSTVATNIRMYPLPVIYSGASFTFNEGKAPEGTIILYTDGTNNYLYAYLNGVWKRASLT